MSWQSRNGIQCNYANSVYSIDHSLHTYIHTYIPTTSLYTTISSCITLTCTDQYIVCMQTLYYVLYSDMSCIYCLKLFYQDRNCTNNSQSYTECRLAYIIYSMPVYIYSIIHQSEMRCVPCMSATINSTLLRS